MSAVVLSTVLDTAGPEKVAMATLNRPDTLNGLTLEMCHELTRLLEQWEDDPTIAFVILRGAGERSFCAGGDLHSLYASMQENTERDAWNNGSAREFFDVAYRLDYLTHRYGKPILCWGSGIVMGGGVGLMIGASHRVVTDTTRFAMPEISIGLFPDVGGTWMLSRLPDGIGMFLALTGAQLGSADCELLGLADYTLAADSYEALLQRLQAQKWDDGMAYNHAQLRRLLLEKRPADAGTPGPLEQHYTEIRQRCGGNDLDVVDQALRAFANHQDPWLQRAAKTYMRGSPGSARLSFILLKHARFMTLAEVFGLEYIVSLNCGVQGDLQEGIRALIIDKDKSPRWNPATLEEASHRWVQRFFELPWPAEQEHPRGKLGKANWTRTMMTKIAFIGRGHMGNPMALNLVK